MSEPIRHTMPYEHPDAMEVAMGDAFIAAIAHSAPHECKDRDCPGDVNRRKLEAVKALIELPNLENRVGPWQDVNDAVRQLIAAWK